jgi:hypothetical protein
MKKIIKKEELYCRVKTKETPWVKCTQPVLNHELFEYAIDENISPAIEAPAGYRIVSIEDQKKYDFPKDCSMLMFNGSCFVKGYIGFWKSVVVFAAPSDYVFAEDMVPVKQEPKFVEYPIHTKGIYYECRIKHLDFDAYSYELPSIVGFAGVKFKLNDNGLESNWTGNLTYHYETKEPATPIAARFYIKGETK